MTIWEQLKLLVNGYEPGLYVSELNGKYFFAVKGGCLIVHPDGITQFISNRYYTKTSNL